MIAFSRWLLLAAVVLTLHTPLQAADNSAKPLLENDRVRVTRVELSKDGTLPNDNRYDGLTLQLATGQTAFLDPGHLAKTEPRGPGQVHYFVAGTRRAVKNMGKQPVSFVQVQFLQPQGKYVAFEVPPSHYCNPGSQKACVTEQYLFCTDRFCAESVTLAPGASSTQHTHDADHMVIATSDFTWREEITGQSAADHGFKVGDVKYVQAGVSHRLTNVGNTTAHLFVVQFK